ncbi:MAG: hypothetical protein AAF721_02335 [Myxococcota bacterium]
MHHGGDDFGGEAMLDYLDLERVEPVGSEIFVYPDATAVNDPELVIAELGTAEMQDIQPPTCQRRAGCASEMVLCSYSGGHQIPGWTSPAEYEFQQVTMDFFRSH